MVVRQTVAARPTAVLAATTTWPEYPAVWKRLLDGVHANIVWGGSGHKGRNVMLYLDDTPRVEVGVELDQPAEVRAPVFRSHLPAGEVATTVHRGPYSALGETYERLHRWCAEQGLAMARVRWEVYGHGDVAVPEVEIYWLLD